MKTLSEKRVTTDSEGYKVDWIHTKDVKQFIKDLKKIRCFGVKEFFKELDKLAGERLL